MTAVYELHETLTADGEVAYEPYVDGRWVSWRSFVHHEDVDYGSTTSGVKIEPHRSRGFLVPMENSLTLSTIWGSHTYSDNHFAFPGPDPPFSETSATAELACWWEPRDQMERWPDGDSVCGWFHAECWWALLDVLSRLATRSRLAEDRVVAEMIS